MANFQPRVTFAIATITIRHIVHAQIITRLPSYRSNKMEWEKITKYRYVRFFW